MKGIKGMGRSPLKKAAQGAGGTAELATMDGELETKAQGFLMRG